jgi:hypothetical protein
MNRFLRVFAILVWFDIGLVLVLLPWSMFWESNYFLNSYPGLIPVLLNPYLRGAISGLGFMDALMAIDAFRRYARAPVPRSSSVGCRT